MFGRFRVPHIVVDMLFMLGLIAYGIYRLNAVGLSLAGIVTTSAIVTGALAFSAQAEAAITHYYENPFEPNMRGDEFITPSVITEAGVPRAACFEPRRFELVFFLRCIPGFPTDDLLA